MDRALTADASPSLNYFGYPTAALLEELAAYLVTQSNVIAAVEAGAESVGDVTRWIIDTAGPLFRAPHEVFRSNGTIAILRSLISSL